MSTQLETINDRISVIDADLDAIVDTATRFKREVSAGESDKVETLLTERKSLSSKAKVLELDQDKRNANGSVYRSFITEPSNSLGSQFHVSGEVIYTQRSANSYFGDTYRARNGDSAARERLDRHNKSMADTFKSNPSREMRAITTVAGAGGEFVPPLWLIDDYITALRPARATADVLTNLELPEGTDLVNIPKIATGTTTAFQATQNSAISQTDLTTTSVPATVYTIAGGQTFSMQLFEQSPIAGQMDKVILSDLMADYARQVGSTVINGTGTGAPFGLLNVAGITSTAYTDASPAFMGVGKLYAKIGSAVQSIQTTRFAAPTAIVMHPRRWAWISVQVDSSSRAVILPGDQGPLNASGISASLNAQGAVGRMFNVPVIIDPNIPINTGSGTNQDPIIVLKADDTWLYEGTLRAEVFPQTYANQLSMFARVYNYMAMATRLAPSIAVINGTGLITPTF